MSVTVAAPAADVKGQPSRPQQRYRDRCQQEDYARRLREEQELIRLGTQADGREASRRRLQESIERQALEVVGRADGARRDYNDDTVADSHCHGCGTQLRVMFTRHGSRPRSLLTLWGAVSLQIPRIVCACGATVEVFFHAFAPWGRRDFAVSEEVQVLAGMCVSLRQIRLFLDRRGVRVSLGALSGEAAGVEDRCTEEFSKKNPAPGVIHLDGVWANIAEETGEEFIDAKGRKRRRKKVQKRPLLVAWGIWPESGRKALLGWVVGRGEDEASWQKLLEGLHRRGVHEESGLRLLVHDGSAGLEAALGMVSFGSVQHQRCLFHKLRNLMKAVKGEEGMSKAQRKERRDQVLADLLPIWAANDEQQARQQAEAFAAAWEAKEPKVVACLREGIEATLAYYRVEERVRAEGKQWDRRYMRATSALERQNRTIRQKLRQAVVMHSAQGLLAHVTLSMGCRANSEAASLRQWLQGRVWPGLVGAPAT